MKNSIKIFVAVLVPLFSIAVHASTEAIEQLRQAMLDKDLIAFDRVLQSGRIGLEEFGTEPRLYELLCASTYETYSPFFERLLGYGVDPSTENPTPVIVEFSWLVCAYGDRNTEAFTALLDAGARTEYVLCSECAPAGQRPLVQYVVPEPEMFLEIAKRREFTPYELSSIVDSVEKLYIHDTWEGQPVNEFYADWLRERGYESTPRRRKDHSKENGG